MYLRCDVRPPDGGSTWPQQPQPRPRPDFVTWVTWDEVGPTWGPSFGLLGGLLAPVEDFLAPGLRHCYYHHCHIRRNHFLAGFHFAFCPWDKWCTGYKSLCTALELSPTPTGVSSTLEWLSPSIRKSVKIKGTFTTWNLHFFTRSLTSWLSVKNGFPSRPWCWTKAWISKLKLSVDGHSDDWVASSHFSKSRANRGNKGCLKIFDWTLIYFRHVGWRSG